MYFSRIDLVRAYYLISITEEYIPKTLACTTFGLFELVHVPFDFRNPTKAFQRYMEDLPGLLSVLAYIDNVYSKVFLQMNISKIFRKYLNVSTIMA